MDSEYRSEKAALSFAFWAIVDANWQPWEQNELARLWKAFEGIRR